MSKTDAVGPKDASDWNEAWSAVSQLAAARGTTLRELGQVDGSAAGPISTIDPTDGAAGSGFAPAADLTPSFAPMAPDQLARDIAEIERAAAALRRAEPALEPRLPGSQSGSEPRVANSIWLLVCVIWLTAAAVVSCAIGAIMLLLR
jgi:hypothetical protein